MSERRRRRKVSGAEEGSDSDLSETEAKVPTTGGEHGDSEYESADEQINSPNQKDQANDEDANSHQEIDQEGDEGGGEGAPAPQSGGEDGDLSGDDESSGAGYSSEEDPGDDEIEIEGDGEDGDEVDDDDDKKNPQYIPKKGMFYEHDDRLGTDEEEEAASKEVEAEPPKRVWKADAVERWGHDKFKDIDQEPKSKDELVASYGYDIRNEDSAPRARRRRRYGRGPNKYTRNWEDENAYSKPGTGPPGGRKNKSDEAPDEDMLADEEEFPALLEQEKPEIKKPTIKKPEKEVRELKDAPREQRGDFSQRDNRDNQRGRRDNNRGRRDILENGPPRRDDRRGGERDDRRGGDRDDRRGGDRDDRRGGGGRGQGRGAPNRGGRGQRSDRGGMNRGGYEDRRRQDRFLDRKSYDDHDRRGYHDDERGGSGGTRGRGYHDNRGTRDRKPVQDQSVIVRPEDLGEDLGKIDINKGSEAHSRGGAKRYSAQRRGGGVNNNNMARDQNSMSPEQLPKRPGMQLYEDGINPAMTGPPRGAPFQQPAVQQQSSARMAVTSPGAAPPPPPASSTRVNGGGGSAGGGNPPPATFIPPQQIISYQNSPVQFSVPASAGPNVTHLGVAAHHAVPAHTAAIAGIPPGPALIAAAAPGFANGPPPPPPEVILAAAAAASTEGFAAVRGGVTYFNPTAQNVLPQRPVSKRPKAAIPIVDPAVIEGNSSAMVAQEAEIHN